jgi:hypothetical protein
MKKLVLPLALLLLVAGCVAQEPQEERGLSLQSYAVSYENLSTPLPLLFANPAWNHTPITVYIDEASGSFYPWFTNYTVADIRDAINDWDSATGADLFEETPAPEAADVVVRWYGEEDNPGAIRIGEGGVSSVIWTDMFNLCLNGELKMKAMGMSCLNRALAVHELGHVLGLGHSNSSDSVMYPWIGCARQFDQDTKETVKLLFSENSKSDLFFSNASSVKIGNSLGLYAEIKNRGATRSGNFTLLVSTDSGESFTLDYPDLLGGYYYWWNTTQRFSKDFSNVTLTIDPQNMVEELDESNNVAVLD